MEILSDSEQANDRERSERRKTFRVLDLVGVTISLPAAAGVFCVVGRVNLSAISLAMVSILFLVSLASALCGILMSFWMRSVPFLWGVRIVGAGWLGICVWAVGQFVVYMSGFSH